MSKLVSKLRRTSLGEPVKASSTSENIGTNRMEMNAVMPRTLQNINEVSNLSNVQTMTVEKITERGTNRMEMNAVMPRTLQKVSEVPNLSNIQTITVERITERIIVNRSLLDKDTGSPIPVIPAAETNLPDYKASGTLVSSDMKNKEVMKKWLRTTEPWKNAPNHHDLQKNEAAKTFTDNEDLMKWWGTAEPWENAPNCHNLQKNEAAKTFTEKARHVKKATLLYDLLLSDREETLRSFIRELLDVAENLNKVSKGAKIAGITGGAAGAAGVAAAVGGILFAPLTLGASLAVTAVGVGVAAAGGVTGASAAITNKVNTNIDRKRVEKILQDYTAQIEDIENCVVFIRSGIEYLNSNDLSELHGVDREAVKVAKVAKVAKTNVLAINATSMSSGMIQGFALCMDIHFTKDDKNKLKKGLESKFAKQIREVAKKMKDSIDELVKVNNHLKSADL